MRQIYWQGSLFLSLTSLFDPLDIPFLNLTCTDKTSDPRKAFGFHFFTSPNLKLTIYEPLYLVLFMLLASGLSWVLCSFLQVTFRTSIYIQLFCFLFDHRLLGLIQFHLLSVELIFCKGLSLTESCLESLALSWGHPGTTRVGGGCLAVSWSCHPQPSFGWSIFIYTSILSHSIFSYLS